MAQFQFVMRAGPSVGKAFPLEGTELTIGRDTSNPVSINDAEVSRKHAKLELRGSAYLIQDLGSTNGTFVNGMRITGAQVLNPGDTVSFGENIMLMYEAVMDPNATMLSAKAAKTAAPVQRPAPAPAPVQAAPAPVQAAPAPAPAYSGQVPAGPVPVAAPKKKGNTKVIIIIAVVVVVCIILSCVGSLIWADADVTGARWCTFPFSIIANLMGAGCQ